MSIQPTPGSVIWRKGKKVILRPFLDTDLFYFLLWINNPSNTRFLSVTWPMHETGQRQWFDKASASSPDAIRVAVCTHDGVLIGNMGLDINVRLQTGTTGSLIGNPEYQGKGYGHDAKMLLLDYAFNWRGLRKVTSSIIDFNGRSQGYAKKCGYRHMATIEQEYFHRGKWCDEKQFVVFREEWLPLWEDYTKDWTPEWEKELEER
jgi:RimJ/RimL family protein N-acetyltransferase